MNFRRTEIKDIDRALEIIEDAKFYFKENGIDQWQNGYPNREAIISDMEKGDSYVIEEDSQIIGTSAISFGNESNYDVIYDGKWITDGKYGVVHRVAVDSNIKGKGLGSKVFKYAEELALKLGINSIRVDTHRENIPMQRLIEKNDFIYCGIILVEDGTERLAYEKKLI